MRMELLIRSIGSSVDVGGAYRALLMELRIGCCRDLLRYMALAEVRQRLLTIGTKSLKLSKTLLFIEKNGDGLD